MDKYYTPEISEFFVGFEFEILYKEWEKSNYSTTHINLYLINSNIDLNKIRVKYLSKEDIESLGFNITKDNEEIELSLESKKYIGGPSAGDDYKIVILYGLDNKEMWIYKQCNNGYEYDLFKGLIKNKSELIKLLKQLGIG